MHKIEAPGATADNRFTEGDPSSGIPATQVSADWLNGVQSEIVNVLLAAGIAPKTVDTETGDQLVAALQAMGLGGYASATDARALSSLEKLLTPGTLDEAFKGGNQQLDEDGFQILPGGYVIQLLGRQVRENEEYFSWPINFPENVIFAVASHYSGGASDPRYFAIRADGVAGGTLLIDGSTSSVTTAIFAIGY